MIDRNPYMVQKSCPSCPGESGRILQAVKAARRAFRGSKACSPKRGALRSRITSLSTASSSSADSMPPSASRSMTAHVCSPLERRSQMQTVASAQPGPNMGRNNTCHLRQRSSAAGPHKA